MHVYICVYMYAYAAEKSSLFLCLGPPLPLRRYAGLLVFFGIYTYVKQQEGSAQSLRAVHAREVKPLRVDGTRQDGDDDSDEAAGESRLLARP